MGVKLEVFRVSELWSRWAAGFFPDLRGGSEKRGFQESKKSEETASEF